MHRSKSLIGQSPNAALEPRLARLGHRQQETFFIEDGWVFCEHHGKYVECICRSDQIVTLWKDLSDAPLKNLKRSV